MALPSYFQYGLVTGIFAQSAVDGVDADRYPDGVPLAGLTLKFTANLSPARVKSFGVPVPMIFSLPTEYIATTNANGEVVDGNGQLGIWLISPLSANLNPSGWTWKVTISGPTFPSWSFDFVLPVTDSTNSTTIEATKVDLSTVVPVPPSPGTSLQEWYLAVAAANAAADRAEAAAGGSTGLPAGGTVNQVLTKNSSAPGDAEWKNATGGVTSVNSQTGVVNLTAANVGAAATSHTHTTANVTGLDTALAGKAATSHTHTTANVTGLDTSLATLQTNIDGKAATSHTHTTANVTGLDTALAGKAATSHTHTASQVGLGNVDNTSDSAKPVSVAQQVALDGKVIKKGTKSGGFYVGINTTLPTSGMSDGDAIILSVP